MAGLRFWDGASWQVLLGGPPQNAVISSTPPSDPPNGLVWVQPVDPIVDMFSPATMGDASLWSWAGFGYGWPGLLISETPDGIRADWNPTPEQNPAAGQLPCAPLLNAPFAGHQMLAQMTVHVPTGSPDVRLTHAFTSSSAWITQKDEDVTVAMNFIWQNGMPLFFGPESTPGPTGGSVLIKDIHLYDLTSSPPSPMRVWDESVLLWLPINDGLVQRAGDRMVGSLRFDTIDTATGQPTVTGLPTPVEDTDAVPLGFLNDLIDNLPVPPDTGGTSALIVSDTEPPDPGVIGAEWIDPSVVPTYPEMFVFQWPDNGTPLPVGNSGTYNAPAAWAKAQYTPPADGILVYTLTGTIRVDSTTATVYLSLLGDGAQIGQTVSTTPGVANQYNSMAVVGSIEVQQGVSIELGPGVLTTTGSTATIARTSLVATFTPGAKMTKVVSA